MKAQGSFFTCQRDGLTIRGMLYKPDAFDAARRYPVVLCSHGFTADCLSMEPYCQDFAAMGYVSLCFGFCGGEARYAHSSLTSDGDTTAMCIDSEVRDLLSVMDYARSLSFVDTRRIILCGSSQGGFVSGMAAARRPQEVSKLIMIYPALCIPDHARRGCLGGASYDPANAPDTIDCGKTLLGRHFHEEACLMEPYLELSPYKGPVLILHGTADTLVNYTYSIRAQANYEPGQCRLQLMRDMGHGMDSGQYQSAMASIRQFLRGWEEVLTIRVIITHTDRVAEGNVTKSSIYFTGYCETPYFQGAILPGACDHQEHVNGVQTKIRAEYTLEGLDSSGERCSLHIINQRGQEDFVPVIHTDSRTLSRLNSAELTAVLEGGHGGPTVRIFADSKDIPHAP